MPLVRSWYGVAFLVGGAAACAPKEPPAPPAAPAVDSTTVKAAVADLWQRWSIADTAGNVAALADMVADSVRIDKRGAPPILGRAAWKSAAELGYKRETYTSMRIMPDVTVAISNELAYENGSYLQDGLTGKRKSKEYGRYAGAIAKEADGHWRVRYIMVFADSTVAVK